MSPLPPTFTDKHVCILGLGFVGLTLATVMAEVGFSITGVEIREKVLALLQSGDPHFFEPGLSTHLKQALEKGHFRAFKTIPPHCLATVYIVTVGTPLDPQGKVNLQSIIRVAEEIAAHLKDGDMVIMRSTLKLGTTRQIVKPLLDSAKKRYALAFCPERTVEGQAIEELRYLPQIIGADDLETANRAAQLFQMMTPTVVRVNGFETAEMIKLNDNTWRDVRFAYANELAHLCDTVGISTEAVITAGRFGYSRTDLPMPGPVGGPCLSKDGHILAESMAPHGVNPTLILAARHVNETQPLHITQFLTQWFQVQNTVPQKITLLGLAFKGQPETDDIRGTMALSFLQALKKAFPQSLFYGYDPVVPTPLIETLKLIPQPTLKTAFSKSSAVLILNNHPAFLKMPLETLANAMAQPGLIYDCWNLFIRSHLQLPSSRYYIALGSHQHPVKGTQSPPFLEETP